MKPNDLGQNQIQPAAQPVSSFITTTAIEPARPAQPSQVNPFDTRIATVQTPGRGNVEGANNGLILAQALSRFNENLMTVAGKGLTMYASGEYRKGQNEAVKASLLAQRQMDESSVEYANENRALARKDPLAGLAMDTVNPFRLAGRRNAISQIAGSEIGSTMKAVYEANRDELVRLDPGDPKINEIKAQAIDGVLSRYGLTPDDPGFLDYVLPQLNRSWEAITAQQTEDRQNWLKGTLPITAPVTLRAQAMEVIRQGGAPSQAARVMTQALDRELSKLGLPGEASEMGKKIVWEMVQSAIAGPEGDGMNPDTEMLSVLEMVELGDPAGDANGIRPTAGVVFKSELLFFRDRVEGVTWTRAQREREVAGRDFESAAITEIGGMADGPEKAAAIQELVNSDDPRFKGLSATERLEAIKKAEGLGEDIAAMSFDSQAFEDWMLNLEDRYGNAWDSNAAAKEFQAWISRLPAGDVREEAQKRFLDLSRRKEREKQDMPSADINKAVDARIKANLEREYPDIIGAAAAGVQNMGAYLAQKDPDAAESFARQRSALTKHVYGAINAARAKLGRPLSPLESQEVISKALGDYGSGDPKQLQYLFPGGAASGAPTSVPGGKNKRTPQGGPAPAGGAGTSKPSPQSQKPAAPTFGISRLPDVPDARLKNWRNDPIISQDSLVPLVGQLLQGQDFPRQVKNAARKAGTSPGQFVLKQLDLYPGTVDLTPAQRNQILRQGQRQASTQRMSDGLAASYQTILGQGAGWMARILIPPASAAEPQISMRTPSPGGGGGGNWESGPAVSASHPDTGSGWAVPGVQDHHGRPLILSRGAANSFARMVRDSGGIVKGSDVASAQRSPGKNAAVGGVSGSKHLGGGALDVHGASGDWIRKNGARYGWRANDYSGTHGGHYEFDGSGGTAPKPAPFSAPKRGRSTAASPKGPGGWSTVVSAAQVAGVKFPQLAAAMWALESGWGSKPSARHNYFNQKDEKGNWKSFSSFGASLDFLATRWFKDFKGFKGANSARNINEAIQILIRGNYVAGDPNYGAKLMRIMRQQGARI